MQCSFLCRSLLYLWEVISALKEKALQGASSEWPIQYMPSFADVELMPCVLLCRLLLWEGIRIPLFLQGHTSAQAAFLAPKVLACQLQEQWRIKINLTPPLLLN